MKSVKAGSDEEGGPVYSVGNSEGGFKVFSCLEKGKVSTKGYC